MVIGVLGALVARAPRGAAEDAGGRTARQVLRTVPGGCLLDSGEGTSDAAEFGRIAGTGYRTREAGDQRAAGRLLRTALGPWRGPAPADVTAGGLPEHPDPGTGGEPAVRAGPADRGRPPARPAP
ncbi:BTAD domain-containing putative transcriptional regulator [Streptomyces sp. 900105755]